ncbi:MAG: hypothetical protein ACOCX0_05005 [Bacteroidota bacterium]
MTSIIIRVCILIFLTGIAVESLHSQSRLIRRLQEKTEERIVNEILGESEEKKAEREEESKQMHRGENRKGAGLDMEAPDVKRFIAEAEESWKASDYIMAKSSVRDALWGVEIEIGKKVLESMPKEVEGLAHLASEDRVSSAGAGFVGLIIERIYEGGDQQLRVSIGNDSALLGLAGIYMRDGGQWQTTDETNQKQIRFQEQRAVISYTDYDGYTLSVPFGQSSVFVLNGINFENESQFMAAANSFSINQIKKELGDE